MGKLILKFFGWLVIIMLLVRCGTIYTGVGTSGYQTAALSGPATPQACQDLLAQAQQKLTAFSAQQKTGAIDMSVLRKMLDEATASQETKDYTNCEVKAQEVMSYIQRDQNYVQWDRSLSP